MAEIVGNRGERFTKLFTSTPNRSPDRSPLHLFIINVYIDKR